MEIEFSGEIFNCRGPSPFHFIAVPALEARILKEEWTFASYGRLTTVNWVSCVPVAGTGSPQKSDLNSPPPTTTSKSERGGTGEQVEVSS